MRSWWIALGLALVIGSPAAAAECDLRATSGAQHQTYDPFSPTRTVVDLTISIRNAGDAACGAAVYVRPVDGALRLSSDAGMLSMQVENASSSTTNAAEFGPLRLVVPANGSNVAAFRFVIPAQQVVPRGTYAAQFDIRTTDDGGADVPLTGASAIVTVDVPTRVDVSISGVRSSTGPGLGIGTAMMDFGTAEAGKTERLYVGVWSNGSVSVQINSANGGILKQVEHPDVAGIPYTARFDGTPIRADGAAVVQRTPPLSLAGGSYELAVTLGSLTGIYAGTYRDVITIDVNQN